MELLRVKGQRAWSVGLAGADLVDTIVNNKKKVHSVSTLAKVTYFHSRVLDFGIFDINHIKSAALLCQHWQLWGEHRT